MELYLYNEEYEKNRRKVRILKRSYYGTENDNIIILNTALDMEDLFNNDD